LLGRIGLFRRGRRPGWTFAYRRLGWTFAYHDKPQTFTIQSPRTGYRSRKCAGIAVPCSSAGTNPAIRGLSQMPQSRERSMKLATITMAGTAALTIIGSAAFAQQPQTGTITRIDRTNGTVVIQNTPSGTTGAGSGAAAEE